MYYLTIGFAIFLAIIITIQILLTIIGFVLALETGDWKCWVVCGITALTLSITIPLAMWTDDLGEQYHIQESENICGEK